MTRPWPIDASAAEAGAPPHAAWTRPSAGDGPDRLDRDHAQAVRFVTGHLKDGSSDLPWGDLVAPGQTLVFYMGLVGLPQIGRRDQPLAFFVEQRERAGFADAKARQVVELDPLCVGVVEADEQHGDHLAGRVLHRRVLGHVVPVEEERAADVLLSTE